MDTSHKGKITKKSVVLGEKVFFASKKEMYNYKSTLS